MTTKAEISKVFAELRKYGYLVFNFNQKNRFGKGLVGFVDHLVIGKWGMFFVEVKIGKDTVKPEQEKLGEMISRMGNRYIHYEIIHTTEEAVKLRQSIIED